jgi:hypothetical protein
VPRKPRSHQKDGSWIVYAQALITMAPGVYVIPEVGYYDYMDDVAGNDQGWQWYAGAKWQITGVGASFDPFVSA